MFKHPLDELPGRSCLVFCNIIWFQNTSTFKIHSCFFKILLTATKRALKANKPGEHHTGHLAAIPCQSHMEELQAV